MFDGQDEKRPCQAGAKILFATAIFSGASTVCNFLQFAATSKTTKRLVNAAGPRQTSSS